MFKKPIFEDQISISVAFSILLGCVTGAAAAVGSAYAMREKTLSISSHSVDLKLNSYVPVSIFYSKLQEKDDRDQSRYYDLKNTLVNMNARIDVLTAEFRRR